MTIALPLALSYVFFRAYMRPVQSEVFGYAGRGLVAGLTSWSFVVAPFGVMSGYGPLAFFFFPGLFAGLTGILLTLVFRLMLRKSGFEPRGIVRALLGTAAGVLIGAVIAAWFAYNDDYDLRVQLIVLCVPLGVAGALSGIMAGEPSS